MRPVEATTRTVLVVDDEPVALNLTARMLRSLGYGVIATDTAASAITLAVGGARFDCVLTDLTMPGMCGQELARRLMLVAPGIPVVFMSGYPEDLFPVPCEGGRAESIQLDKPFTMAALNAAVREAIG